MMNEQNRLPLPTKPEQPLLNRHPAQSRSADRSHSSLMRARICREAAPMTAYIYDWNMLPIGQLLWEKELMSYKTFPPLQAPETYNLDGILKEIQSANHPSD
jgi:hypothetical protein